MELRSGMLAFVICSNEGCRYSEGFPDLRHAPVACPQCARPLVGACPHCGMLLRNRWGLCTNCGALLFAEPHSLVPSGTPHLLIGAQSEER